MKTQAKKAAEVVAAPAAPVIPTLPQGVPPKGGRGKSGPFTGATTMAGLTIPQANGEGSIDYMLRVMLANPAAFVSREQLAQAAVDAGFGRSGLTGALHTARCQTGKQGTAEHGMTFTTGLASDGNVGYTVDKAGSERNVVGQIKIGAAWGEQPKPVSRRAARGFPWVLVTSEAKAAGFVGVPYAHEIEATAKQVEAKPAKKAEAKPAKKAKK